MAIRTQRINQTTPVSPINLEGLLDDTKNKIEQISNDILDAFDVTEYVSRTSNGVLTDIAPDGNVQGGGGGPSPSQEDIADVLDATMGGGAGDSAGEVKKAIDGFDPSIIDILLDIAREILCSVLWDGETIIFAIAGYFSISGLCDPADIINKVGSVTEDLYSSNPGKNVLKIVEELEPGGIRIVTGDPKPNISIPDIDHFDPNVYDDFEISILIGNDKVPITDKPPLLGGYKSDKTYTTGTLVAIPTVLPPEIIPSVNKAVGLGLTENIRREPNNTVAAVIYLANPSWVIKYMPALPQVLISKIKRKDISNTNIISRNLLEHMDSIYPVWYRKATPVTNEPFVGMRDYYEASATYLPNARCLSDLIKLTGAQKLKLLTGARHSKYRPHKYPIIGVSL